MKLLFILMLLFTGFLAFANERVIEKIKSGDTLELIAKRNIYRVANKYGNRINDYAEDIKKWNPKITDWAHPPKNQLIYLDYPYAPYASGSTWAPALGIDESTDDYDRKNSLSIFYASSFGSYDEKTGEQSVTSGQNFPVTLGLAFSSSTEEKKHFIISSGYWAQASKGNVTSNSGSNNSNFTIPGEIGANLYYQYYIKENSLGLYSGYDFEKLNTFNTNEMIAGSTIANVDNKIHYATLGLSKGFFLFQQNMNIKASFSKTIASSSSGTKPLTGAKYILYYTWRPEGRFGFSAFFKHHTLSGPTDLSINRIGVSVSLSIF